MTLKHTYECDVCGKVRKEANHWWIALPNPALGFYLQSWVGAEKQKMLDKDGILHLCGQECVHKCLDRFMTGMEENDGEGKTV